jgi:hypothetical protein
LDLARFISGVGATIGDQPGTNLPDLQAVLEAARSDLEQPSIEWPQARWIAAFPQRHRLLSDLPALLSRVVVRDTCGNCSGTPRGAVDAFIVSMAWGYGRAGYGVFRTQRVLSGAGADAGLALDRARHLVVEQGALAGYEHLAGPGRLLGLGPAFGTKFLFFQNEDALILDKLIADWFLAVEGSGLRPTTWSSDRYGHYLETMRDWAQEAGLSAVRLEEAAFTEIARARGSQWASD